MLSHSHSQAFLGICWRVITENVQIFSSYTNQKYNVKFLHKGESKSEKCSKEIKIICASWRKELLSEQKRITARRTGLRIKNVSWKKFEESIN